MDDAPGSLPGVVLDTNAVLDGWVFGDPGMRAWALAIEQRRLRWVACAPMREELAQVLGRPQLARWSPDPVQVLLAFDQQAEVCPRPPARVAHHLRCSDPDDQVFLDLGIAQRACWLLTKDRALLRLARPALRHGLRVIRPAAGMEVPDPCGVVHGPADNIAPRSPLERPWQRPASMTSRPCPSPASRRT